MKFPQALWPPPLGRGLLCLCWLLFATCAARAERLPVRVYTTSDGLSSSAVNWVTHDSRGFLWFGTRDGLSRFDGQKFTTYRVGRDASPSITQIIERRRGDYMVVTQAGGLYRFDLRTHASSPEDAAGDEALTLHAELLAENLPGLLYEDRSGRLWMAGGPSGLFRLDESGGGVKLVPVDLQLPGVSDEPVPTVSRVTEARDGSLWMSTGSGLVRRAPDGRVALHRLSSGSPMNAYLTGIHEDAGGHLWVGSRRGLYVLKPRPLSDPAAFDPPPLADSATRPRRFAPPEEPGGVVAFVPRGEFDSNLVFDIFQTSDGRVWVTNDGGLSVFDGRELRSYGAAHGLGRKSGMIAEDSDGNLWLSGMNGASKLVTRGLTTYGKDDGLGARVIQSFHQTHAGEFYVVGGDWRVSRLDGDRFKTARPFLGDAAVPLWTSNAAFLDSAGAWWFLTEKRLYRFDRRGPLEALDTRRPSAVPTASLRPRRPSSPSRISPPVWARWWFAAGLLLLFGAGVYTVARAVYLRKLELERVRTRIASDLHDDIGASLTRISMLSEVARRQNGGSDSATAHRLTQIAEDARGVIDSMSDIVWAIDPRRDDLASVFERVRSFASDCFGATGVRWHLTAAPQLERHHLTPEQRRALYLIFKEAVSNIARHADCRTASCEITVERQELIAVIEDDGRGLPLEQQKGGRGGRGLANMRARAEELGGRLEVESRPGEGTRLRLRLPLRADMNMLLRIGRG